MPGNGPVQLPAYVQLRYEESGVFSKLESEAANVTGVVRRDFEKLGATAKRALSEALTVDRNSMGGIDIGVARFRELARAQQATAETAKQLAAASARVAAAEGAGSIEARRAADAFAALAAKEHNAATEALAHANVMAKVQAELARSGAVIDQVAGANRRLSASNDNAARSAGAHRMGMIGLGQQLQDSVIQAQMGTSALTIFAQQGSQAAYQLSGMGGAVGTVARTLAGPWGAALFAGTALLGPLISGLFQTSGAMKEVEASTDAMGTAQGILGNVLDLTTGKITSQRSELMALARAQIIAGQVQSKTRAAAAKSEIQKSARGPYAEGLNRALVNGSVADSFTQAMAGGRPVRNVSGTAGIASNLLNGVITTDVAIKKLEQLHDLGKITDKVFQDLATTYANLGVETANAKIYQDAEKLLNGQGGANLLKPAKPTKGRTARTKADTSERDAARLKEFGADAAEAIRRANEQWDEAPSLIDKAARSTRDLDGVIADLEKRRPLNFQATIAEAEAAKVAISDALVRPAEDARAEAQRRLAVQELLAQGRDDEAAGLQAIQALEAKLGDEAALRARVVDLAATGRKSEADALQVLVDKYPLLKAQVRDVAIAEQERTRELQRQQALMQAQLDVLDTARRSLTDLFSGRGGNPLKEIGQSLKDLSGARLADDLFGDAFKSIEDQLRNRTPLGQATEGLITGVDTASTAVTQHAETVDAAMRTIRAAIDDFDDGFGNKGITVTGTRPASAAAVARVRPVDLSKMTVAQLSDAVAHGIVDPLAARFDQALGATFARNLTGTISGALSGYMQSGAVGSALGGARGLAFDFGPDLFGKGATESILSKFDGAMGGAQMGSQIAGLTKALGIKTSTTGAQIGGAVGSFIPIPGGQIIGAIAGGLLGGLFKHNTSARALITGVDSVSVGGADRKGYDAASGLGDTVTSGLRKIADAFDAEIGNFSVAIGTRGDDYRVNTTGSSLKIKSGAKDFGDDAEAATRYALLDAINDGAIKGMREGTLRILKAGEDLDAAMQDALSFEGVFKSLQEIKDPIGAAIATVDARFNGLRKLAQQAGEGFAEVEELYAAERTKAIEDAAGGTLESITQRLARFDDPAAAAVADLDREFVGLRRLAAETGKGVAETERLYLLERMDAIQEAYGYDPQDIADRLLANKDPLQAAVAQMDREFENLRKAAIATGEGITEVEELYLIERGKLVEDYKKQITGSLKGLLDDMTIGDRGLSLRSRQSAAAQAYEPLAARVRAGDVTAYDDFAAAAQSLLGVSRELYGSQADYFSLFNEIKGLTQSTLDRTVALAGGSTTPASAPESTMIVSTLQSQTTSLVDELRTLISTTQQLNKDTQTNLALIAQRLPANNNDTGSLPAMTSYF